MSHDPISSSSPSKLESSPVDLEIRKAFKYIEGFDDEITNDYC